MSGITGVFMCFSGPVSNFFNAVHYACLGSDWAPGGSSKTKLFENVASGVATQG